MNTFLILGTVIGIILCIVQGIRIYEPILYKRIDGEVYKIPFIINTFGEDYDPANYREHVSQRDLTRHKRLSYAQVFIIPFILTLLFTIVYTVEPSAIGVAILSLYVFLCGIYHKKHYKTLRHFFTSHPLPE